MGFTVSSLEQTKQVLNEAGFTILQTGTSIVVPAEEALGVVHYFYEQP